MGTPPFTFDWSNGEITEDISGLIPGIYAVNLLDSNNCSFTTDFTISQPDTVLIQETHTNVSCYDSLDAEIIITPSGGTLPYLFVWSTLDTTQNLDSLGAGSYEITMIDSNDCVFQKIIVITEPDSMYATSTSLSATCLSADGYLDLTV